MKVPANDLFKIVRQIVQEEVKKALPAMIEKHLTETYVRRLIKESGPVGRVSAAGLLSQQAEIEEETPEPPENDDRGVYDRTQAKMNNEHINKLLTRNNPLGFIYEGVKPPGEEPEGPPSIPLEALPGPDFAKMNRMLEGMGERAPKVPQSNAQTDQLLKMKEDELARKRAALEVRIG